MTMPDRWDDEAKDALCCCGRPRHVHTEHCPAMSSLVTHVAALARRAYREGQDARDREWGALLIRLCGSGQSEEVAFPCPSEAGLKAFFKRLRDGAFREGLERARGIALDIAGEYPEDIFRSIEPGELAAAGSLGDRIGAHMARITARNIAAAFRREIEGLGDGR